MASSNYSLSFTTGAALLAETIAIAHLMMELGEWAEVKKVVLAQNTLQARTESTLKKLYGEISRRLKSLSDEEIALLATGDDEEQKQIIWLAICRHYTFIHDFDESEGAIKFGQSAVYEGTEDGFVTESSYGYRARVVAKYSDVFAGINLTPILAWKHDLEGWAPNPGGAFNQGEKSLGLTLKADYLSTYNAAISYTQYMDGDATKTQDRDFASITVGMQF